MKGKGAIETEELIRQELNEPKAQVASIGLAGVSGRFDFLSIISSPQTPNLPWGLAGIFRLPADLFQAYFYFRSDHILL